MFQMKHSLHKKSPLLLAIVTSFYCSSCVWMTPAEKRIAEARDSISKDYLKQVSAYENGQQNSKLHISWQQGLEKMYLSNPVLIQADFRLADAKDRGQQVWRNMIPGLSVGLSNSSTIGDVADLLSDSSFRLNSFVSLGNLLTLPTTTYTNKLTYIGSALTAENTMRQQVIALYRLFQEQRLHRIEKQALDLEAAILASTTSAGSPEILTMKLKHKESYETWKENTAQWRVKVGDFFMQGYDEVTLLPKGIPDIIYNPKDLDFTNTKRWGMLQLNLLALERIAEDGRILDTYFRYLPRTNLSVSAPPLYNNSSGQTFDPALIRLGPSLNWNLDSRGSIGRQLDRLKRNKPLDDWRKDKRTREEVKKLFEGREQLVEIKKELAKLHSAIKVYKTAVRSGLVKDPERAVQTMRKLKEKEVRLMAKEIEICSAFWLIDEQRWKSITKRWLETRKQRNELRKNNTKGKGISLGNQLKKM